MEANALSSRPRGIGNVIAPPRFILFACVLLPASAAAVWLWGWRLGLMIGFDVASLVFLASCHSLFDDNPNDMRETATRNDANRAGLLAITVLVVLVILAVVANVLMDKGEASSAMIVVIVVTLVAAWLFANTVYAIHYAHMYYTADEEKSDTGGLVFPETKEPNYWDFIYFAFCLGMTFQTSDVNITSTHFRGVVTLHCLAAFVFNLGVLAFTINVLSG
ncbi:DUF1345 domain-containing protein [Aquabacter sp. CN5-332]|uniref:DUF1345 domain-containing protein n=1 Tax=Aquabacter sp. CN5-332 TaxID=3156608 RepID=UPI0032B4CF02